MKYIAEIVVSEHFSFIESSLSYIFDDRQFSLTIGDTVQVPFGQKKILSGIVVAIREVTKDDDPIKLKEVLQKLSYSLPQECIEVAKKLSGYYFAPLQKCIRLFLPKKIWSGEYQEKPEVFWSLNNQETDLRGEKQKQVINYLSQQKEVEDSLLREEIRVSLATLKNLEEKGVITRQEKTKEQQKFYRDDSVFKILTSDQEKALKQLQKSSYSLLHGVTGAGKTEVFLHFFRWIFEENKNAQCLLLVPEIALTPQMIHYFQDAFPKTVEVVHSQVSENERCRIWQSVESGETKLVIGSRSALFLPWKHLESIIIDEAHEWTYKSDLSPKFHAKKVAEFLKPKHLILSSATPDVIDMYQAQEKKIQLVELKQRIQSELPPVTIVDMRQEFLRKNFSPFSEELQREIKNTLLKKKQIILFLNKRGFAKSLQCKVCGHIEECPHCSIPMTHHWNSRDKKGKLICHYCFLVKQVPDLCAQCGSDQIQTHGIGTQKIEEEIQKLFPQARIIRADRDSMSQKGSFEKAYNDMKENRADILLGTQMISKGLDLANVHLVGVLQADQGLHIPDFRSSEKVFQLLMQVAGRAGRQESGKVIFQTFMPYHEIIQAASSHSYGKMYDQIIEERKHLSYPPFSEVIKLTFVNKSKKRCMEQSETLKKELQKYKNVQVTSAPSYIPKIADKYYWNIIIRGENMGDFFIKFQKENLQLLDGWRIDRDPVFLS